MPKSFVIRKIAFFELFVSKDLLGPIEVNLKLAQKIFRIPLATYTFVP